MKPRVWQRPIVVLASALAIESAYAVGRSPDELPFLPAFPLAHELVVRQWDQQAGMPDHDVLALARTRDGYLWVGTRRGVSRFDGARFTNYDAATSKALPAGCVQALHEDADGTLWIGTTDGLAKRVGETFERVTTEGLPEDDVRVVYSDRKKTIWVGTTGGLARWDGRRFVPVTGPGDAVVALAEDAAGRLWAGSYGAFLVEHDQMKAVPLARSTVGDWVRSIQMDSHKFLWLATESGLVRINPAYDPLDSRAREVIPYPDGREGVQVWAIAESRDGQMWIGTGGNGLLRLKGRQLVAVEIDGFQGDPTVKALATDSEGNVWMGTAEALVQLREPLIQTVTRREGLSSSFAWAVLIDHQGAIWTGTQGGGLNRLHHGKVRVYGRADGLRGEIVVCLGLQSDGTVWAATRPDGLVRIKNGQVEDMTARLGLQGDRVRAIHEDPNKVMWFGTRDRGLVRMQGNRLVPVPQAGAFAGEYITQIETAADGALWVAADSLARIEAGRIERFGTEVGYIGNGPYMVLEDGPRLWVATEEAGLMMFRDGHFTSLTKFIPAMMPHVYNVIADELGYLWLSSDFGLQRLFRQDLLDAVDGKRAWIPVRSFDKRDGLASTEFNSYCLPGAARAASGRLWFPTAAGLVSIDPRDVVLQRAAPAVRVERIVADDREWTAAGAIELPAGLHRFQIDFTALALDTPERTRFRYQLEGVDPAWVEAGAERSATYTDLQGRDYQFKVQAFSADGAWNAAETSLPFTIERRTSEQPWFYPLIVILAVATGVVAHASRATSLRRRARRLERAVAERTQLLSQARDRLEARVQERTAALAAELAARQRLEEQLVQSRLLERVGRLAGGVAHNLNNLMTAVLGYAELVEARSIDEQVKGDMRRIRGAGERAVLLTQQLLGFARKQHAQPKLLDAGDVLRAMAQNLRALCDERVSLQIDTAEQGLEVWIDPLQFEQVIANLVANARDATPAGGLIEISARTRHVVESELQGVEDLVPGVYVELSVVDHGAGMSEEARQHLFEPYFTTKNQGEGTGLGLASSWGIVMQNRGRITVQTTAGMGTTVSVLLPQAASRRSQAVS